MFVIPVKGCNLGLLLDNCCSCLVRQGQLSPRIFALGPHVAECQCQKLAGEYISDSTWCRKPWFKIMTVFDHMEKIHARKWTYAWFGGSWILTPTQLSTEVTGTFFDLNWMFFLAKVKFTFLSIFISFHDFVSKHAVCPKRSWTEVGQGSCMNVCMMLRE